MTPSGTPQFAFFGDSLTDNGNLFRVTDGLVDDAFRLAETGWRGRISNGPTWAEHVAGMQGLTPSLNYAIASSEAIGAQTLLRYAELSGHLDEILVPLDDPRLQFDMNLGGQVERFAADTAGGDRSQIRAFIEIGANDYGNIDLTGPLPSLDDIFAMMQAIVDSTLAAAAELAALGVAEVIVAGLPSARFIPSFAALPSALLDAVDQLLDLHNGLLKNGVNKLKLAGWNASGFEMPSLTDAIAGDPDQFGILAPWQLTLRDGDPADLALYHEDQVGFWDSIHPSAATHGVLGALVAMAGRAAILGDGADDHTAGNRGDLVLANGGGDMIRGRQGADRVFLGQGDDDARLQRGRDFGSGGTGNDAIRGGRGSDVLAGGGGNDLLSGQRGRDVLIDGAGDDTLRGGDQADLFIFFEDRFLGGADAGANRMVGGRGDDRLILVLGAEASEAFAAAPSQADGLRALGIDATGIETVDVVDDRAALETALAGAAWYAEADLWGLL